MGFVFHKKETMKFRLVLIIAAPIIFLTGCSLASDITPPPNYVSPTPLPTLGMLYPASASNVQNGAAIFAQNCEPCHGDTGLGNGPQSQQLPVTVPALGLADTARSASPAQWFTTVSQGNLDRFMPPFIGALSDQDRWDVVSYALTLHTKPDQISQGKALFDANCPNCASKFTDQKTMAALSENDIIRIIQNDQGDIHAFGKSFNDSQALDVAMYIRTLTFAAPLATAMPTATAISTTVAPTTGGTVSAPTLTSATTAATASTQALSATPPSETSTDFTLLKMDQIHIYSDFATQGQVQFIEIYAFTNPSSKTVIVSSDGVTIPFIKFPEGSQNTGYEPDPNSAQLVAAGNGVAAPPNSNPYAIIAFFTLPYSGQLEIKQPFETNAPSVLLLMPEGITVTGDQLASAGIVAIQNNNYQEFSANDFHTGDVLDFTVSGTAKVSTTTSASNSPAGLFIGAGVLGLALIGAGAWFFFRDRKNTQEVEEDEDEDEFESADEVMDAILALDDLHRAGKINEEAYQKRRAVLKEILKGMM
jgi:mono/diheme cytochrome c family protein